VETGTATLCHAQPGDVVVADSAYGTYVDLALVHSANADAVFRKHHARHCDFRRGKKLGIGDHIVQWQRPGRCQSMPPEDFGALPASIEVREVHLLIQRPGFRPTEIILVTTLVDPKRYPKAKLAHLYQLRWQATEVNFKHLKTTLKMEMILPKPEMVQKEDAFACVQLAAKLDVAIGAAIAGVALADVLARSSTTVQSVQTGLAQTTAQNRRCLYSTLLHVISDQLVPFPHRAEPRVTKEDPRVFPECSNLAPSSKLSWSLDIAPCAHLVLRGLQVFDDVSALLTLPHSLLNAYCGVGAYFMLPWRLGTWYARPLARSYWLRLSTGH